MSGTIRFSSEEFYMCIQRLSQIKEFLLDHREEYVAICSDDLSDMPEEVVKELLIVRESFSKITEELSADIAKMYRIAEVYEFYENKNHELVATLSTKAEPLLSENSLSSNKRQILQWNGKIRSGRLISNNILMDDWLYEYIAGQLLNI